MADEWPLRSYLEVGALPSAVPCLRLRAKQRLWEWGLTELSDSVELLVSELATNALRASAAMEWAPAIRMWLLSDKESVLILLWDADPQPPVQLDVDEDSESGRGLLLVEAVSGEWGTYPTPEMSGKVVWAIARKSAETFIA